DGAPFRVGMDAKSGPPARARAVARRAGSLKEASLSQPFVCFVYCNVLVYTVALGGLFMKPNPTSPRADAETVVISFRAPVELVKQLDELARGEQRNRANFILRTLTHSASAIERLAEHGEFLLKVFHDCYVKDKVGRETEFRRGQIAGWKQTLVTSYGASTAEQVILRASEVANLPVPHSGTLAPDGSGYEGFDSFSHMVI
ncbi:MAG: hypothetical protein WCC78_07470, partial [Terriglobales bacterium]